MSSCAIFSPINVIVNLPMVAPLIELSMSFSWGNDKRLFEVVFYTLYFMCRFAVE